MQIFETLYKYRQIIIMLIYLYILFFHIKPNDYLTMLILTATTAVILCKITKNQIEGNKNIEETNNELSDVLNNISSAIDSTSPETPNEELNETNDAESTENEKIVDEYKGRNQYEDYERERADIERDSKETKFNEGPKGTGPEIPKVEELKGEQINKDVKLLQLKNIHKIGPFDGVCLSSIVKAKDHQVVSNDQLDVYQGSQSPIQSVKTQDNVLTGPTIDGEKGSIQRLAMFGNNKGNNECCDESPYMARGVGCVCLTNKQKKYLGTRGFNTNETGF